MRIGEMAEAVGMSGYTLRYYEKEGLLRVRRDASGRRRYDENDVAWVQFIKRLKDTGMPLKDIREYSRLRYDGNATMPARLNMLEKHREYVLARQREWTGYLSNLDGKIAIYKDSLARESVKRDLSVR